MIRSSKMLIPAVGAVLLVAAFWFLVLAPKREEAAKLTTDIAAKQSAVAQARTQIVTYEKAKAAYSTNYATLTRLGKAVPADDDVRSLMVQINGAADRAKVDFHGITIGAASASAPTTPSKTTGQLAPPPGTVPVGSAGFSAMPFSFGFEGSFFRLSDFLQRIERFVSVTNDDINVTGRLLLLGSINVTPQADSHHLTAQIGATSYLVPPAQGLPGVAAPTTPSGGAQGSAPAAAAGSQGTTTSTPSATITGVR